MGPVDVHFERLKSRWPDASLRSSAGGGHIVTVPNFQLPQGWNKSSTAVHFWAQQGYPFAKLDCFWADADLRLASGNPPQNSGQNGPPELTGLLWFSWHTDHWNAARDDFLTWLASIRDRLNRSV
jgi:hypothetical protein